MAANFLPGVGNDSIGQRTVHGTWLPPGSRVAAYVGPQSESTDAYVTSSLLVSTLAAGLARCRSGKGDVVAVLPGHTETISTTAMFTNLVAGTQIIGCAPIGSGLMPTFTWAGTTTAATATVSVANVTLNGLRFNFNGADSMDTPLVVSGINTCIQNCYILTGSDTALDSDVGVTVSTGADNFLFRNNYVYSTGTAVNTNAVLISGSVDSPKVLNNTFILPATSTNGILEIGLSAAVTTNMEIANNVFVNKGSGTSTIRLLDTAMTGVVYNNYSHLTGDASAVTTMGISLAGTTNILVGFFQNFTNDTEAKGRSGILSPVVNDAT